MLEERLEEMDRSEDVSLFLASNRLDGNERRRSLLDEMENVLQEYGAGDAKLIGYLLLMWLIDALIEKNRQTLNSPAASRRDVRSLRNWIAGNPCLARDDSAYLGREDLFRLAEHEGAISGLEGFVEDLMIKSFSRILSVCFNPPFHGLFSSG